MDLRVVRVVVPVTGDVSIDTVRAEAEHWAGQGTSIDVVSVARGVASIESAYDEALAGPGILDRVSEAAAEGVDAIFISCFGDPAVHAAREIVDIPVVGGYEPAMLTALTLGEHVGIVTVLPNVLHVVRGLARRYEITGRVGDVRFVNLPVLDLQHDSTVLVDRLYEQSAAMVKEGKADVIVLGCTGMLGVAQALQDRLDKDGVHVPVVDPTAAAITWLESSVRMGLRPSRTAYMPPPQKARNP